MNWLSLITALVKFFNAVMGYFRERQLIETGRAEGRAESDADHAQRANETGAAMQAIADKPPGENEIDQRLEKGDA